MDKRSGVIALGAILCLTWGFAWAQGWIFGPVPDFQYSRFDGEYYPPTGKVYFLGGRIQNGGTAGRIWSYDPMACTFTDEQVDMEFPVSDFNVGLLNDPAGPDSLALYVVGGLASGGTYSSATQVYYPISGLAMALASDPWPGRIGSKVSRPGRGIAVSNNRLYVFGGLNTNPPAPYASDSTYVYDPSLPAGSRWSTLAARLSLARGDITPAVVDGKVYALGGLTYDGSLVHPVNRMERFDPADPGAGWVRLTDLPDSLSDAQAFGFDSGSPYGWGNHIIVAGFRDSQNCRDFDIAANRWSSFPPVNLNRNGPASFFLPGTLGHNGIPGVWVLGGDSDSTFSSEFYQLIWEDGIGNEALPVGLSGFGSLGFKFAPNPFVSFTTVPGRVGENFELYDISGRRIGTYRGDRIGQDVRPGVYFVRAKGETGITARIIKVR